MNQSLIFNDDIHWHPQYQLVSFSAQYSGALITCYIKDSYLEKIGVTDVTSAEKVNQCQLMQFDIEEDAQQAIDDERLNDDNELWLD